ncbi:DJ-1 family glyoxalase III [Panacagrimonas sp.]|uniref:DJ-1 family glyoxalase III n=1 Tax=Panacagrimonas sp. TaxID=2480088 RepID=UPI003B52ADFE
MKVLIPIAHGSESLETITLVNLLRRASIEVDLSSIESDRSIEATRGIRLHADSLLGDRRGEVFDAIVLPGGEPGSRKLAKSAPLAAMLTAQRQAHRWYGAICAAPALTLSPLGLLDGKQATCYPSLREHLLHYVDLPVVIDGHCITSQGPGTAQAFALTWIEKLAGVEVRRQVAETALIPAS